MVVDRRLVVEGRRKRVAKRLESCWLVWTRHHRQKLHHLWNHLVVDYSSEYCNWA